MHLLIGGRREYHALLDLPLAQTVRAYRISHRII